MSFVIRMVCSTSSISIWLKIAFWGFFYFYLVGFKNKFKNDYVFNPVFFLHHQSHKYFKANYQKSYTQEEKMSHLSWHIFLKKFYDHGTEKEELIWEWGQPVYLKRKPTNEKNRGWALKSSV